MIHKFYNYWGIARSVLIALACLFVLSSLIYIKGHAATMDGLEYVGPGSEAERTERHARDKQNERAHERERRNDPDRSEREKERDRERAAEWSRDHQA